jgi:hypothetical protein
MKEAAKVPAKVPFVNRRATHRESKREYPPGTTGPGQQKKPAVALAPDGVKYLRYFCLSKKYPAPTAPGCGPAR